MKQLRKELKKGGLAGMKARRKLLLMGMSMGIFMVMTALCLIGGSLEAGIVMATVPVVAFTLPEGVDFTENEKKGLAALASHFTEQFKQFSDGKIDEKTMLTKMEDKLKEWAKEHGVEKGKLEKLEKALEDQGTLLKNLSEKGISGKQKSILEILTEKKDALKAVKEKKDRMEFEIEVKAADTITTTGNITPQPNAYLPSPTILPGIVPIVRPDLSIASYITHGTTSSPRVVWVNEVSGEGDAEWVAEGALKPLVDFDWKTEDESVKKIAAVSKISEEMLEDISWMESEVRRLLVDKLQRKIDTDIVTGNGTGSNILGILERVGGYVQTCLNGSVDSPALVEVLVAAKTQIRNLGFKGQLVAFVNPCDWAIAKLRKDGQGNVVDLAGMLDGITVVEAPELTAGEFFIGDMARFVLDVYKSIRVEVGWENDDFRRNLRTIIAEARMLLRISSNNIGAFVYDSIASVQSLIAKP